MTQWLLEQGHWAFVILAWLAFGLALLVDAVPALTAEGRLRRELAALERRRKD